jgi:hypothetical protein
MYVHPLGSQHRFFITVRPPKSSSEVKLCYSGANFASLRMRTVRRILEERYSIVRSTHSWLHLTTAAFCMASQFLTVVWICAYHFSRRFAYDRDVVALTATRLQHQGPF